MIKFIPKQKLSKKAKRELDQTHRQVWGEINPVTRKFDSKKIYKREKSSRWFHDDGMRIFFIISVMMKGPFKSSMNKPNSALQRR